MLHSSAEFIEPAKTKFLYNVQTTTAKQRSSITSVAWHMRFGKKTAKLFPVKWSNHSQGVDTTTGCDEVQGGLQDFFTIYLQFFYFYIFT
jgi:hypothetical protein